jgi:hypothetical protein
VGRVRDMVTINSIRKKTPTSSFFLQQKKVIYFNKIPVFVVAKAHYKRVNLEFEVFSSNTGL